MEFRTISLRDTRPQHPSCRQGRPLTAVIKALLGAQVRAETTSNMAIMTVQQVVLAPGGGGGSGGFLRLPGDVPK